MAFAAGCKGLNFWVALFLIILVADLVQYWTHHAYHGCRCCGACTRCTTASKSMDWMAGSRQHILELIITRSMVLAPIYVLGFSKEVIDAYIVIVGFQAVFNHANVSVRLGPLRYVLVTPNFHHWHHSQDQEALDKTTPRTSRFWTTCSAPPSKAPSCGLSTTACWATTCPTDSSNAIEVSVHLEG